MVVILRLKANLMIKRIYEKSFGVIHQITISNGILMVINVSSTNLR